MQPRYSLAAIALFSNKLKAACTLLGCEYVLMMKSSFESHQNPRLFVPAPTSALLPLLLLPTHRLWWLAPPRRFWASSLQPLSGSANHEPRIPGVWVSFFFLHLANKKGCHNAFSPLLGALNGSQKYYITDAWGTQQEFIAHTESLGFEVHHATQLVPEPQLSWNGVEMNTAQLSHDYFQTKHGTTTITSWVFPSQAI